MARIDCRSGDPVELLVCFDPALGQDDGQQHATELEQELPKVAQVHTRKLSVRGEVKRALQQGGVQLCYVYCHAEPQPDGRQLRLRFGNPAPRDKVPDFIASDNWTSTERGRDRRWWS